MNLLKFIFMLTLSFDVLASQAYTLKINNNVNDKLVIKKVSSDCITGLSFSGEKKIDAYSTGTIKFDDKNAFLTHCDGVEKYLKLSLENKFEKSTVTIDHYFSNGWGTSVNLELKGKNNFSSPPKKVNCGSKNCLNKWIKQNGSLKITLDMANPEKVNSCKSVMDDKYIADFKTNGSVNQYYNCDTATEYGRVDIINIQPNVEIHNSTLKSASEAKHPSYTNVLGSQKGFNMTTFHSKQIICQSNKTEIKKDKNWEGLTNCK
ncbi:hypothetical protein AB4440_08330 [Vibrio splendidus]|uniref:hypothetical protein n=2 Tax=Vibrio TaxID=662 RepID=UPI000C845DB4|nr:hypothetical protein [Vibrio splendidus]PMO98222.1 hypothetical protein BCS97_08955 [Vibrio splendidus]PMP29694.1 hypothetical protein BCS89_07075 [Vibrio splendidus]PMP36333.1 hypothetical protein BCS88_07235 [Vibrio splendidus]PMP45990.1 hypothetical protein BCS87_03655 [Vibrio splendidus]PMP48779.1 hypothetical protein BCS85_08515 [Vibrio splendidus]